ncbi:Heterokaryon incompatibility protein [Lasiodiplodia theobromae]|uniref:Heterokaryon incompatibility protein n=1 Tax=Lasiodiplodia theobromae TaxID=45133 RepID=UPI0015C2C6CD|nr:Heterokaryon incompatibility protein [Lasiodiplodia theobromae]KAF4539069.1 Heterokaryon incompatibility protein [Lasiodiplodia theobromae]
MESPDLYWLPQAYSPGHAPEQDHDDARENIFFGSIGQRISKELSDKEMFKKHGFSWPHQKMTEEMDEPGFSEIRTEMAPCEPCASCGGPVGHIFAVSQDYERAYCKECMHAADVEHVVRPKMVFNENVDHILDEGPCVTDANKTTTKRIPNEHYTDYKPLDKAAHEIRLVFIMPAKDDNEPVSCVLLEFKPPVQQQHHYIALSYCWGEMQNQRAITLAHMPTGPDGGGDYFTRFKPFRVTENLHNALRSFRKWQREYWDPGFGRKPKYPHFWIDALCINQNDNEERSYQVGMMGQIYASAANLWIWLGEDKAMQEAAKRVKAYCNVVRHEITSNVDLSDDQLEKLSLIAGTYGGKAHLPWDLVRTLSRVFDRPWFTRIWVLQEVFRTRGEAWIHIDPENFVEWTDVLLLQRLSQRICAHEQKQPKTPVPTIWAELVRIRYTNTPDASLTVLELFRMTCTSFNSGDPRDKLFALFGLAREMNRLSTSDLPARLAIDYDKTEKQLFCDFTRWCIENYRNLDVLSVVAETVQQLRPDQHRDEQTNDVVEFGYPSWALWHRGRPDPTRGNLALSGSQFSLAETKAIDMDALNRKIDFPP